MRMITTIIRLETATPATPTAKKICLPRLGTVLSADIVLSVFKDMVGVQKKLAEISQGGDDSNLDAAIGRMRAASGMVSEYADCK